MNLESLATGQSGQIELTPTQVSNLKVPKPPIIVQKQLCKENNKLYSDIAKKQEEIVVIKQNRENIISDIFCNVYKCKYI